MRSAVLMHSMYAVLVLSRQTGESRETAAAGPGLKRTLSYQRKETVTETKAQVCVVFEYLRNAFSLLYAFRLLRATQPQSK